MKCHQLTSFFRAAGPKALDRDWLAEFLAPHCRISRLHWRGTRLRVVQIPWEFASWLVYLARLGVRSYLEVGTSTGGSFYVTDSYLRATVPGFRGSVGYDRVAKMRDLEAYVAANPGTEFRNQHSRAMHLAGEQYDAAFIDARHVDRAVCRDYARVAPHAQVVGFHDVMHCGGTVWEAFSRLARAKRGALWLDDRIPMEARCGIGAILPQGALDVEGALDTPHRELRRALGQARRARTDAGFPAPPPPEDPPGPEAVLALAKPVQ